MEFRKALLLFATLSLAVHAAQGIVGSGGSASGTIPCYGSASGSGSGLDLSDGCCPMLCEPPEEPPEPSAFTEEEASELASCYLYCLSEVRMPTAHVVKLLYTCSGLSRSTRCARPCTLSISVPCSTISSDPLN